MERFTIEIYDDKGYCLSTVGVADAIIGLRMVWARATAANVFDFVTATCYHYHDDKVTVQWELEIK